MATVKFQLRRDAAANWASVNPTLGPGEPALETDSGKGKHGDGVTPWNALPYSWVPPSAFMQTLLDDADAPAARSTLGLGSASLLASDSDPTLAANSAARVATQSAVKAYVDAAVTGLLDYKGGFSASSNPNYPAAQKGDAYVVTAAGRVGGASGKQVDVGDVFVASADNAGGAEASVGASWFVLEHNLQGALLAANNLSDLTNLVTARANLGLAIGSDVQAYSAKLGAYAGGDTPSAFVLGIVDAVNAAAFLSAIGAPSYEEGAWTPVLSFSTPPTTPFTMDVVGAKYTKVGRQVTVQAFLRTDNVNLAGAAGFLQIRGLPYAASGYYPVQIASVGGWVTHPSSGYVDSGSTNIYLLSRSAADGATALMGTGTVTSGAVADANSIMISATYFI
jgi:hypothetical protein